MKIHASRRSVLFALAASCLAAVGATQESPQERVPPPSHAPKLDRYYQPTEGKSTAQMPCVIIRSIRKVRDGSIWFASFGGPIRYDGKTFTNFGEQVGLPRTRVFSLLEDRSGSLWCGSITDGVTHYDGKSFQHFTQSDGLNSTNVYCMCEDKDGNIWFGSADAGACRYDGKKFTNFSRLLPVRR